MAGRKQGPGLPFTPWDQIKIGLDPSSKLPENFQKSVASIFGAASKKRDAGDDEHGSRGILLAASSRSRRIGVLGAHLVEGLIYPRRALARCGGFAPGVLAAESHLRPPRVDYGILRLLVHVKYQHL